MELYFRREWLIFDWMLRENISITFSLRSAAASLAIHPRCKMGHIHFLKLEEPQ
jgi:hypothetical protein